jgi:hypothetical protein
MMKVDIKITGTEAVMANLRQINETLNISLEDILNSTAFETSGHMKALVPYGVTGGLGASISVDAPDRNTRLIGPGGSLGSRGSPGPALYGYYVSEGNRAHFPNMDDVARRYGIAAGRAGFIQALRASQAIARRPGQRTDYINESASFADGLFERNIDMLIRSIT